ncbi:N/A [soil metagenome]
MQTNPSFHTQKYTVYPGEYIPMIDVEELNNELTKPHDGSILQPFINVSEHRDHFKVEAAIPGLNREDFYINIDEDILSIAVLHKKLEQIEEKKFQLHEFNYDCFNRNVILPQNIEKDFVKAEYRDGMLSLYFPKTNTPGHHPRSNIIVY